MSFSKIEKLIELFNDGYFEDEIKPFFGNIINFFKYVKSNNSLEDIDLSMTPDHDFNDTLFDFIVENNLLTTLEYRDIPDELKNSFLLYGLEHDYERTVIFITDQLITDISIRPDGFYQNLRDRSEVSELFCEFRSENPKHIAELVLSEDYNDWYDNFYGHSPYETIEVLDEKNLNSLKESVYKKFSDQEFSIVDFNSSWFEDLSDSQNGEGFFKILPENLNDLFNNKDAINELLNDHFDDLASELSSLYSISENMSYESEVSSLVYDGLTEFYEGNFIESYSSTNKRPLTEIKVNDFIGIIKIFLNENKYSGYNDSTLDYYGDYTSLLIGMFENDLLECISFRIPDYPDSTLTKKFINEYFNDYIKY